MSKTGDGLSWDEAAERIAELEAEVKRWKDGYSQAAHEIGRKQSRIHSLEKALRPTAMSFHRLAMHSTLFGKVFAECPHMECAANRATLVETTGKPTVGEGRAILLPGMSPDDPNRMMPAVSEQEEPTICSTCHHPMIIGWKDHGDPVYTCSHISQEEPT